MSNPFLSKLVEQRQQKAALIDATMTRAADEDRDLTDVELANIQALALETEKLDARIEQVSEIETRNSRAAELAANVAPAPEKREIGGARVVSEELTYSQRGANDFLTDALAAEFGNDYEARERISRHQREMVIEKRDVGTSAFAGLVVPQYLTDLYAPLARAGRPLADICRKHVLPAQGMTVNISRVTTGTAVGWQAAENDVATETNIDDTLLTVNVNTISGMQDVSKQAIMRGTNIEGVVLQDLIRAYHTKLDQGIITGDGTSGTPVGLDNLTGENTVTYTDASPSVAELYPKLADAVQQIQAGIYAGPTHIVMHPRRLGWLLSATDTTNRPLVVPNANGPMNAAGTYSNLGYGLAGQYSLFGLPIITDANIPTNLGAGTNEDEIYVIDANELHLWETQDAPMYVRFEQPDGRVAIRIVLFGFAAFTGERYPKAVSRISGTGLVAPTF